MGKGDLVASIHSDKGSPVAGAILTVKETDAKGPVPELAAVSNQQGELRWSGLPEGHYKMKVGAPGFKESLQPVTIVTGQVARVTFVLMRRQARESRG